MKRLVLAASVAFGLAVQPSAAQSPQNNQVETYSAWTLIARAPDLSVTTVTSRVAFGTAGPVARVCNIGGLQAYVSLGGNAVTATLSGSIMVPQGACVSLNATGATYIAALTPSDTTTLQVELGTGRW